MQVMLNENCTKDILDVYIERNFTINVPNEDVWRAGGFASLRLTDEFYKSESAARIFRYVYGIKDCQVRLDPINVSSIGHIDVNATDNQQDFDYLPSRATLDHNIFKQSLNVECKKKKPTMILKYPRKTQRTNCFGQPATASKAIRVVDGQTGYSLFTPSNECPKNQLTLSKINNEGIHDKRSQNVLQPHVTITSIPIEKIARFMTRSELRHHLRKTLHDHFDKVEMQFEKYLDETDVQYWSLKHFLDKSTATKPDDTSGIERLIVSPEAPLELTEMSPWN